MAKYSEEEKRNLKTFFTACNEMINGRFILSDIKIQKILNAIASSSVLYELFAKCMVDFNFKNEFRNAKVSNKVNGGYFVMPDDQQKIIALVFCFLIDIDNGRINLQNFINENFFSSDGYNISYSNFAINVLVPFKSSVASLLGVDENGENSEFEMDEENTQQIAMEGVVEEPQQPEINTKECDSKLKYANLLMALNQLYSAVKKDKKLKDDSKQELIIIIKAIKEAITIEKLIFINALVIPLEHTLVKNKNLKNYYLEFKNSLMAFYD